MHKTAICNADNERTKRRYFSYLKEARGYSSQSIDSAAIAIVRFEAFIGYRDFKTFTTEQAIGFKRHLAAQTSRVSGKPLSKGTVYGNVMLLKQFFTWLAGQPGYRSRVRYSDVEYFSLSEKDSRIATARRSRPVPTLEQIRHVLTTMPSSTDIDRRNRALLAFTLLTGARDGAIATMKLKHVDLSNNSVYQDASEVQTKFSKTFRTYFFPVGDDVRDIVSEWVRYLRQDQLWGHDDPLFPSTRMALGPSGRFEPQGLERSHWKNSAPIRTIFRNAFVAAGLPYFNPHSFRNTLVRLGEARCSNPEQFKAWSQNLGHEQVLTTFTSYGEVAVHRQGELIQALGRDESATPGLDPKVVAEMLHMMLKGQQSQ